MLNHRCTWKLHLNLKELHLNFLSEGQFCTSGKCENSRTGSRLLGIINICPKIYFKTTNWQDSLYSVSLSSGSDVVRLFAKRSAKSRSPRKIAHAKTRSIVHVLKSSACVLTSLPEDSETEYRKTRVMKAIKIIDILYDILTMSSNRTTVGNNEQGSYCFTM